MRKIIFSILAFILTSVITITASAANLIEVYQHALACDPTFKSAEAEYLAAKENVPIARSYLLPNLNLSGMLQRQMIDVGTNLNNSPFIQNAAGTFYNTYTEYLLSLSQPVFNYSAWQSLSRASYQAKQAEATFAAAAQDLMLRTAQAYFSILQASDNLRYTAAQRKAVAAQLRQARHQYDVGLIAITGLKEAQAQYDTLVAQEIGAKNNLANAVEALRAITARTYPTLMGTNNRLPLVKPNPASIDQWVQTAEQQNYALLAAVNGASAAQQNIKMQQGGHLPVVNATAAYESEDNTNGGFTAQGSIGPAETRSAIVGLNLNFPVYQGGLVNAQTRQAAYLYQQAVSDMEYTHRSVIQEARNAYLGVITGINQLKADRQTIAANQASLKATLDGYEAGTRTMVNVLDAQSLLYQSQKTFSQDQYNYLTNILTLKRAAGTLSPTDLIEVNNWLLKNTAITAQIANLDGDPLPMPVKSHKSSIVRKKAAPTHHQSAHSSHPSQRSSSKQLHSSHHSAKSSKSNKSTSSHLHHRHS